MEINDLFIDLRDGRILLKLLEVISGDNLPSPTPGRMRIHCLENVDKSLYFLTSLNVHLENVGAHDIVDGNARITLGLLWTIILRFQIQDIAISSAVDGLGLPVGERRYSKDALLLWCQMKTAGYRYVDVQNFTTSWRDGLAFNALIHKHRPDLVNFDSLSPDTPLQNLESAFLTAEKKLGITRLFDPEDIYVEHPDEKSILTYVVTYYHYFSKLRSETVHARRAANFITYFQRMQNTLAWYEKCTSELLAWIFKTISWIDNRDFPPTVEELQQQFAEFKDYRLKEKAEKFLEKGNLEMELFILQAKMRSLNLKVYKPPAGLQVSQVNRAWCALEKSEHARELALRGELIRQRRLLHLFCRFERKAKLRESWIMDNQKLLEQPDYAHDLRTTEAALKKHEALETDVCAYVDRVQTVCQLADELENSNFFKIQYVISTRNNIKELWETLLAKMRERFSRLEYRRKIFKQFSECSHLRLLIASLLEKLDTNEYGDHLFAVDDLLQRHELFETDIRSLHRSMSVFLRSVDDIPSKSDLTLMVETDTHFKIEQKHNELREAYSQLVSKSEDRKHMLKLSKERWELMLDLDEQHAFIESRIGVIKDHAFEDDSSVYRLLTRHKAEESELESRRQTLNYIFSRVSFLHESNCPASEQLVSKMEEVRELWEPLIQAEGEIKQKLLLRKDFQDFLVDCTEAEGWMNEKMEACKNILHKGAQCDSLCQIETLLRHHFETMHVVEGFSSTIERLKSKMSDMLACSEEPLFLGEFDKLMNAINGEEIPRESISSYQMASGCKIDNVTLLYKNLTRDCMRTRSMLLDAISVHQLFQMASDTYSWIVTKDEYLHSLVFVDLELSTADSRLNTRDRLQGMNVIKLRFNNLEFEMTKAAEQVFRINNMASSLIDGPKEEKQSLFNNEATVERVVNMQNYLNTAWNQLADAMEAARDRLLGDSVYTDLCDECLHTSEWIKDKISQLESIDTVDGGNLDDALTAQTHLKNLMNDMKAIEARVEDIDSRVAQVISREEVTPEKLQVSQSADPYLLSKEQPLDTLLQRQVDLTKEWINLKEAVRSRLDRVSGNEEPHIFVAKLDQFSAWLELMKVELLCGESPYYLQETERRLLAHEQNLLELDERQLEMQELLNDGRAIARKQYDMSHTELEKRLEDLEGEWKLIKTAVAERGALLRSRYSLQYFFSEASLLDVILNQQNAFLSKMEIPTSLDAVFDTQRQHEAFCDSMATCTDRVRNTLDFGAKLAQEDPANRDRILDLVDSIGKKSENNCSKAKEIADILKRTTRLYEFYYEVEDLEDWFKDKKEEINLLQKRQTSLTHNRIQVLEQDVESNRDRGDGVIQMGQQLTEDYPALEEQVRTRLERVHALWDQLISMVHGLSTSVNKKEQERSLKESLQKTMTWFQERATTLSHVPSEHVIPDPSALTNLQWSMEEHERNMRQLAEHQACLSDIRTKLERTEKPEHRLDLEQSIKHLETNFGQMESQLRTERERLGILRAASQSFLELQLEAAWVREKLAQVKMIPAYVGIDLSSGRPLGGQQLLRVQQLRRQLKSHQLETDNRRPRMKIACETVERTYCSDIKPSHVSEIDVKQFRELLQDIRQNWTKLVSELDRLRYMLEVDERVCQFALDAHELEAWLSERELYTLATEKPTTEQGVKATLRKHLNNMKTIDRWQSQLVNLRNRARELCGQLKEQTVSALSDKHRISQLQAYEHTIQSGQARVVHAFESLKSLTSERQLELESALSQLQLLREVSELEIWIAEKSAVAVSHELGTDIDHCCVLRDRFLNFVKLTVPDGTGRVSSVNSQCVRLIARGHSDAAAIALAKDSVNEAWADLLELIETRKQLLKAAWDMHHFVGDCQDTEERIMFRIKNLPQPPTADLISGRKQGLSVCQRSHANLIQELECLSDQLTRLSNTAKQLFPRYAGTQEEQLKARYDRVQTSWQRLHTTVESRNSVLKLAGQIHRFLMSARELIMWLEMTRDQMEAKERPRDTHGVEILINEHLLLKGELEARSKSIDVCLDLGRGLLQIEPPVTPPKDDSDTLVRPIGEVRERCVQLATGHLLVQELWRERWDRLHLLLEVRQFARDASSAEAWLATREIQLEVARRQFGETLSETLTLLGAHYAFEQTLVASSERFNALKRLTTLEIRAMEWKPEEALLKEQEKRDKIRQVVQEFLPQYVKTQTKHTETKPSQASKVTSVPPPKQPPTTAQRSTLMHTPLAPKVPPTTVVKPVSVPLLNSAQSVVSTIDTNVPSTSKHRVTKAHMVLQSKPTAQKTPLDEEQVPQPVTRNIFPVNVVVSMPKDVIPGEQSSIGLTPREKPTHRRLSSEATSDRQTRKLTSSVKQPAEVTDITTGLTSKQPRSKGSVSSQIAKTIHTTSPSQTEVEDNVGQAVSINSSRASKTTPTASYISPTRPSNFPTKDIETTSKASLGQESGSVSSASSSSSESEGRRSTVRSAGEGIEPAAGSSQVVAEQFLTSLPRLEGPVVRKHDLEFGGSPRSKSAGRSWVPLYMVLQSGQLYAYKDYRSRRQKPDETLRGEAPLNLLMARASVADDYTKRPCVFRLHLHDGREYLFQTANDRAVQRWLDAINESAKRITTAQGRSASQLQLPSGTVALTRQARSGSLRFDTPRLSDRRRSLKAFFSLRRKQ
ncbi:Spectrin beta [Paragonimus heterotremus]|uniref:Spectrin beta n=1 Tax=Paragonimus heterotremus TaxID=100268 RepID=A0A8J4WKW4_9TREM|nr:Spectrin beta [Paragonimus heterotremus]